jgi:putative membrane protein
VNTRHTNREEVTSMMWTGTWDGWAGGFVMFLGMLVFWGGLVWLIAYAIREFSRPRAMRSDRASAIQVLEERFARGEIDRDEFEERRGVLDSQAA